jgi:transcriptional regulator with XRE-family HTH domain
VNPPETPTPGSCLRAARLKAGLSQAAAASRMTPKVTAQYWSDVENDRRRPSLDWLWEAAQALGVNPHSLDVRLFSVRPKPKGSNPTA